MRIRRLTIRMPARLRRSAEHDARAIAQALAEQLGNDTPKRVVVDVDGRGATGQQLAGMAGAKLACLSRGLSTRGKR